MLWALIPIVILVLLLALVSGWLRARADLAEHFVRPPAYCWIDGRVPEPDDGDPFHHEIAGLGYVPVGCMHGSDGDWRVYTHRELPVYALAGPAAALRLESFLPGGGRLSTTGTLEFRGLSGAINTGAPRLVQLRALGPVTPAALDGQHLGTVRAWLAGGREFLPAGREALIAQLQDDHRRLRAALDAHGWVSLPEFLRTLTGRPPNVLEI